MKDFRFLNNDGDDKTIKSGIKAARNTFKSAFRKSAEPQSVYRKKITD